MRRLITTAVAMMALATPAMAYDFSNFPTLSWNDKLATVNSLGAKYRVDCAAIENQQPGATHCLHLMELRTDDDVQITLRFNPGYNVRQWCVGKLSAARMVCIDQDTGQRNDFVLMDNRWRSVN